MTRFFRSVLSTVAAFLMRVWKNKPRNPYEKIVFDAAYAASKQIRRDTA